VPITELALESIHVTNKELGRGSRGVAMLITTASNGEQACAKVGEAAGLNPVGPLPPPPSPSPLPLPPHLPLTFPLTSPLPPCMP
jgi:hypothetical protein